MSIMARERHPQKVRLDGIARGRKHSAAVTLTSSAGKKRKLQPYSAARPYWAVELAEMDFLKASTIAPCTEDVQTADEWTDPSSAVVIKDLIE